MNIINLILFISLYIGYTNSSCNIVVNTISEVNPFDSYVPVAMTGQFCTSNSTDVQIIFWAGDASFNCYNVNISVSQDYLTCNIGSPSSTLSFDINSFQSVYINFPNTTITTPPPTNNQTELLVMSNYLYTYANCPSGCTENGVCDIGMTCRCNEGYASFDCSQNVKNETLASPIGVQYDNVINTLRMYTEDDSFDIQLSHLIATSPAFDEFKYFQKQVDSMKVVSNSTDSTGISFSTNGTKPTDWLSTLNFNVGFTSTPSPSLSYSNYQGTYSPVSSSSASIEISPCFNVSNMPNDFSNSTGYGRYSVILEIRNALNVLAYDVTTSQSDSSNAVSLTVKKTNSLLLITLSDIYFFNATKVSNHSYIEILSLSESQELVGYSATSVYIGIIFQQSYTLDDEPSSGIYNIRLNVNVYTTAESKLPYPIWKIILIVFASLFFITILVIGCRIYLKSRGRNSYEQHHHLSKFDESKYLLK